MKMKRNERRADLEADVLPLLYDVARHMRTRPSLGSTHVWPGSRF
jgi:hypothetical protein